MRTYVKEKQHTMAKTEEAVFKAIRASGAKWRKAARPMDYHKDAAKASQTSIGKYFHLAAKELHEGVYKGKRVFMKKKAGKIDRYWDAAAATSRKLKLDKLFIAKNKILNKPKGEIDNILNKALGEVEAAAVVATAPVTVPIVGGAIALSAASNMKKKAGKIDRYWDAAAATSRKLKLDKLFIAKNKILNKPKGEIDNILNKALGEVEAAAVVATAPVTVPIVGGSIALSAASKKRKEKALLKAAFLRKTVRRTGRAIAAGARKVKGKFFPKKNNLPTVYSHPVVTPGKGGWDPTALTEAKTKFISSKGLLVGGGVAAGIVGTKLIDD